MGRVQDADWLEAHCVEFQTGFETFRVLCGWDVYLLRIGSGSIARVLNLRTSMI